MKKLNMSIIKKRMVALGLTAMMVVGMSMPAYARSVNDPGAVGWEYNTSEVPVNTYYVDPSSWLGSYDVAVGGYEYQLTISQLPDVDTPQWRVDACRIPDGTGAPDVTWAGYFYTDPKFGLSAVSDTDGTSILSINNWNGDKNDPDIGMVMGYDPDTNQFYLLAVPSTTHSLPNYKADADVTGISGENAFPPQSTDPNATPIVYKKISNVYQVISSYTFSDGRTVYGATGWTTNGTDRVDEPWWLPGTTSN